MVTLWDEIKETYRYRWVVYSFIVSTLRMRYRRSLLGFGWSVIGPLVNFLVIGLVFSQLGRFSTQNYFAYLLIGSLVFNFIGVGFNLGGNSLVVNEIYIRKIYLPKLVFPLSAIGMESVNLIFAFIAMMVILGLFKQVTFSEALLFVPVGFLLIFFFVLGIGMVLSVCVVFSRDLNHIIPVLMQTFFFATPIVYPIDAIPPQYMWTLKYNPFYHFVELVRKPLVLGQLPTTASFVISLVLAGGSFLLGLVILKRFDNQVIFKL